MVWSGFSIFPGRERPESPLRPGQRLCWPLGRLRGADLRPYHPPTPAPRPLPSTPSATGSAPASPNSIRLVLSSSRAAKIAGIPTLASATQTLAPPSPCAADIAVSRAALSTASPSCAPLNPRCHPSLSPAALPVPAPPIPGSCASPAPGNSSHPSIPRPPAAAAACAPCFASPDPPSAPATRCPPNFAPPVVPRSTDGLLPPPPARCSTARNSVSTS